MDDALPLRRHLYEQLAGPGRSRRSRRALRRQILVLGTGRRAGGDDGSAGVREPRRPLPSTGPARR